MVPQIPSRPKNTKKVFPTNCKGLSTDPAKANSVGEEAIILVGIKKPHSRIREDMANPNSISRSLSFLLNGSRKNTYNFEETRNNKGENTIQKQPITSITILERTIQGLFKITKTDPAMLIMEAETCINFQGFFNLKSRVFPRENRLFNVQ